MTVHIISNALIIRSLRQLARGEEPHLPHAVSQFLQELDRGVSFQKPTKAERDAAYRLERKNNERNARLAKAPKPTNKQEFFDGLRGVLDEVFLGQRPLAKGEQLSIALPQQA